MPPEFPTEGEPPLPPGHPLPPELPTGGGPPLPPPPLPPPVGHPEDDVNLADWMSRRRTARAPPPVPPPPPPLPAPVHEFRRRPGRGDRWGPNGLFLLTRKGNAWAATCPYHRGTDSWPVCRKQFGGKASDHVLLAMAKAWCIKGPEFFRKRTHMGFEPPADNDAEQLERDVLELRPPAMEPLPDALLDELEAAEAATATESFKKPKGGATSASSSTGG